RAALQLGGGENAGGFVIVTQAGSQVFGALVDNVFHTEEIVIKPMSSKLRHIGMFSGMTILGDGAVVMVIDPGVLAQSLAGVAVAKRGIEQYRRARTEIAARRSVAFDLSSGIGAAQGGAAGNRQPH